VFGSSLSELLRAVPRRRPAAAADAVGSEGAEGSQGAAADAVGSDGIEGSQGSAAGSGTPPFFSPLSLIASEGFQVNCKACASGIHARLPCMRCAGFCCPGGAAEPLGGVPQETGVAELASPDGPLEPDASAPQRCSAGSST